MQLNNLNIFFPRDFSRGYRTINCKKKNLILNNITVNLQIYSERIIGNSIDQKKMQWNIRKMETIHPPRFIRKKNGVYFAYDY